MMMVSFDCMTYSDEKVFEILKTLLSQRGGNAIITVNEIKDQSVRLSYRTTRRAISRLLLQGMIERERCYGNVYRYSIPER